MAFHPKALNLYSNRRQVSWLSILVMAFPSACGTVADWLDHQCKNGSQLRGQLRIDTGIPFSSLLCSQRTAITRQTYKGKSIFVDSLAGSLLILRMKLFCWLSIAILVLGCERRTTEHVISAPPDTDFTRVKYAVGFKVSLLEHAKLVEVTSPYQGASSGLTYLLVPRGEKPPSYTGQATIIYTPVERIVCTSTTHIPLLEYIGEADKLVGFPTTDYISSEHVRRRVDGGQVADVGIDKDLNLERLVMTKPDLLMGYSVSGDYGQFRKIESMGIPVVLNAEYLETHPLGRAEWIKFMALFFGKEQVADSVFNVIEHAYLSTKALVDSVAYRPSVLSGVVYGDAWFMPGGKNYAAQILRDAGCRYLWEASGDHGFLQIDFETVYRVASEADLWIGVANFRSLKALRDADHRYARFRAFEEGNVYTYDARRGARGGSEFLELGYLRPDIVLKDLVKIAHPDVLPAHELYFHARLE